MSFHLFLKLKQNIINPDDFKRQKNVIDIKSFSSIKYSDESLKLMETNRLILNFIKFIEGYLGNLSDNIYKLHIDKLNQIIDAEEYEFKKKHYHTNEYHQYLWDKYENETYSPKEKKKKNSEEKEERLKFYDKYPDKSQANILYGENKINREIEELKRKNRYPTLSGEKKNLKIFSINEALSSRRKNTLKEFMEKNNRQMTRKEKITYLEIKNIDDTFKIVSSSERRVELEEDVGNKHQYDDYEEEEKVELSREEKIRNRDLRLTREEIIHNKYDDIAGYKRQIINDVRSQRNNGPRERKVKGRTKGDN